MGRKGVRALGDGKVGRIRVKRNNRAVGRIREKTLGDGAVGGIGVNELGDGEVGSTGGKALWDVAVGR